MIRVFAPSRLHFGIFALPPAERAFGGVGLMIRDPGVEVAIEPSSTWMATGPNEERALAFARVYVDSLTEKPATSFAIHVRRCPPQHTGLGVGTQLAMAVGKALAATLGIEEDAASLARRLGRGRRSSIGVHGFSQGGFLVEGGKKDSSTLAPLLTRHPFPDDWPVLLIFPPIGPGTHGLQEEDAFRHLPPQTGSECQTEALCRLVLLGLLPAFIERDLPVFGEALYDFNRRVGELFRPIQGGVYADAQIEAIVRWLRAHGVRGVGQSSWGPTVFAILEPRHDKTLIAGLQAQFGLSNKDWILTQADNVGSRIIEDGMRNEE